MTEGPQKPGKIYFLIFFTNSFHYITIGAFKKMMKVTSFYSRTEYILCLLSTLHKHSTSSLLVTDSSCHTKTISVIAYNELTQKWPVSNYAIWIGTMFSYDECFRLYNNAVSIT
jgi:hypothetical protein